MWYKNNWSLLPSLCSDIEFLNIYHSDTVSTGRKISNNVVLSAFHNFWYMRWSDHSSVLRSNLFNIQKSRNFNILPDFLVF